MALLHVNFFSEVLGMCMNMDVILPQKTRGQIGMEGDRKEGKYPVLYLLHGMSDDHTIWQRRTSIERYAAEYGIAVVMPAVHLSFYTDMKYGLKYWTFVSEELPQICREFFPNISDQREDTCVAGLSMGGYGAMKLGFLKSEHFAAAASLSGAVDMVSAATDKKAEVFGLIFGSVEEMEGTDNDLIAAATRLKESGKPLPRLYMWCGTEDFLYQDNQRMLKHLKELGIPVTYEESPGDHQWIYWDEKIRRVLEWMFHK
jgi:putative tributyrin esterase